MATTTKQINQYTAAATIDPANDYFLIDPGGTGSYNKINRNTIMGVTGTPADLTSTQTIQNKTINNTNTATLKDGSFTLQNTSDTTKQAKFSLASITTGNTRIYTLPDITDTLMTLTATQTATNKTLTSPTINSPTITNASITADSISGFTISNSGTIYGVPITTGAISNSSAFGSGVILPSALQSGTGSSWVWQSWTPTFVNLAGGTLDYAKYIQMGKTVFFLLHYTMTGADVSGSVTFSLPVNAAAIYNDQATQIGYGNGFQGASGYKQLAVNWGTSTTAIIFAYQITSTYSTAAALSSTVPVTWASGGVITVQGSYQAA